MIFLYPYPYKTFVVVVSGVVLLFVVMAVYMISRLIWERSDKRFKQYMNRILVVCGIAGGVFFFSGFALTMIKIHQVNQGGAVEIPVMREGEPMMIAVQVPEMELLAIKYWPFNKY